MRDLPVIIGLGYQKQHGKDTTADHLMAKHGFIKLAFADTLKIAAKAIFGLSEEQVNGPVSIKETVDEFWGESPRSLMQKLGTECLRKGFREDVWVEALRRRLVLPLPGAVPLFHYVVTDVRFPNEADAIRRWHPTAKIIRVHRPALDPHIGVRQHVSETALADYPFHHTIRNEGTIADLKQKADDLVLLFEEEARLR